MRFGIIYLNVVGKSDPSAPAPEHYAPWSDRFIASYQKFRGSMPHQLQVCHCGGLPSEEQMEKFGDGVWHSTYNGGGWDIGAHQYAAASLSFDFVLCMATPCYFWREGFLERLITAREKYGDGLYGPTASYEHRPHIRNCCWAFDPATFINYPVRIDTREKTFRAESGDLSITAWYAALGKPRIMVAPDGDYGQEDWRKPANVFRRGTQENCFIRDRHWDNWLMEAPDRKLELENWADGKNG